MKIGKVIEPVHKIQLLQMVQKRYRLGILPKSVQTEVHEYLFRYGFEDEYSMQYASLTPELYINDNLTPRLQFGEVLDFSIDTLIDELILEQGANHA